MTRARPVRCVRAWLELGLAFWLALTPAVVWAGERVTLSAAEDRIALGEGYLSFLRDPSAQITLDEALAALDAGRFTPLSGNLGLGFTRDAVWLAATVQRRASAPDQWVLRLEPPTLDVVELHQIDAGQRLKQISGDGLPVAKRALFHRSPAFALTLPEGTTRLLMRIRTTSQMTAIPFLWPAPAFAQANLTETLLLGLYFGALLVVLIYNLVIGFSIRQSLYFLYCLLVITHGLFMLAFDGLIGLYFFPEQPLLANLTLGVLLGMAVLVGNFFWTRALDVGPKYPISRALLMAIYLVAAASIVSVFFGAFPRLLPWLLTSILLSVVVLGRHAVRSLWVREPIEQRIFGASYVFYGGTVFVTAAMNLSLLPANLWTTYFSQLAQLIHILALHLGLYFRVRTSERQRDAAQFELAQATRSIERERNIWREQEQLLQMVGHEVRTPIAIITSAVESLELLEQEAALDPDKEQRYQRIHRAVERIEQLMHQVGYGQRAWRQSAEPASARPVHLVQLCRDNLELLDEHQARIRLAAPPAWEPMVYGDPGLLDIVLRNLLDNALKYAVDCGVVDASVHAQRRHDCDGVCFTVCNRARPLAPGMEERIFEKFVRIDEHLNRPGLGLGLYLARRIAEQHQGRLTARNCGEDRVCFDFWLPLYHEDSE